jgi:4'-phosphopantetheinyl transferase
MFMTEWQPSPHELSIAPEEVHIWRANLDISLSLLQQLQQTLSPDEQQRANRFRFDRDRQHFIAGRGLLRQILSGYLDRMPSELQFTYSERGKPSLILDESSDKSNDGIEFNVSHSHGQALYAIARQRQIGIDLEYIRPLEVKSLAKRFFCSSEYQALIQLPTEQQQRAFFHSWTCKEAYLKATGEGIIGLEQVEVSINPDRPAKIITIAGNSQTASLWQIEKLEVGSDYAAAVAMQPACHGIKYWQWGEV